jgi:hypothetical protein
MAPSGRRQWGGWKGGLEGAAVIIAETWRDVRQRQRTNIFINLCVQVVAGSNEAMTTGGAGAGEGMTVVVRKGRG